MPALLFGEFRTWWRVPTWPKPNPALPDAVGALEHCPTKDLGAADAFVTISMCVIITSSCYAMLLSVLLIALLVILLLLLLL